MAYLPVASTAPLEDTDDVRPRMVLVSPDLMRKWVARTNEGYRVSVDWGRPDGAGHFTPTMTVDYTDCCHDAQRKPWDKP